MSLQCIKQCLYPVKTLIIYHIQLISSFIKMAKPRESMETGKESIIKQKCFPFSAIGAPSGITALDSSKVRNTLKYGFFPNYKSHGVFPQRTTSLAMFSLWLSLWNSSKSRISPEPQDNRTGTCHSGMEVRGA